MNCRVKEIYAQGFKTSNSMGGVKMKTKSWLPFPPDANTFFSPEAKMCVFNAFFCFKALAGNLSISWYTR